MTVKGTVRNYSFLWGRAGKPVILLFDVSGIVSRGSGISDLKTPASSKAVIFKKDAENPPPQLRQRIRREDFARHRAD